MQVYLEVDSALADFSDEPAWWHWQGLDESALWLQCDFCRYVSDFFPSILRFMFLLLESFLALGSEV